MIGVGVDVRRATSWPQLGISRYVRSLLRAMLEAAPDDVRLRPFDLTGSPHWNSLEVARVGRGHGLAARFVQEQWGMLGASRGVDVLHLPWSEGPLRPFCPLVLTVHDLAPLAPDSGYSLRFRAYYNTLLRAQVAQAARVIVPSQATAEAFHTRWPRRPYVLIAHALDDVFRRDAVAAGGREPIVLYTGGFDPRKRVGDLLAAFRIVAEAMPAARLVVTGNAPAAVRGPGVERAGFVSDEELARLYGTARVVAYPSALEGFGFPILEAYGSGTPVVAAGAIEEVAGAGALRVEAGQPPRLAEALLELLRDDALATRLGAAGRAHAAGFRWSETARLTLDVYREVAASA